MTNEETTQIRVTEEDRDTLAALKESGESWPDFMARLVRGDVADEQLRAARMLTEAKRGSVEA